MSSFICKKHPKNSTKLVPVLSENYSYLGNTAWNLITLINGVPNLEPTISSEMKSQESQMLMVLLKEAAASSKLSGFPSDLTNQISKRTESREKRKRVAQNMR
jgi:hypothetical protein